ncbi:MAG: TlpA family protein disulfide reductase [Betaproteobacteria bacterium]|nr:TlpA family protein disulfide reductase [Betaproteobacteria bacterium]
MEAALNACQAHSAQKCAPYAEDARVVFDAKRWPALWRPYASAAEAAHATTGNARGQRFPDLYLTQPNGRPMALSHLRGRPVVLHFWGAWCPACREELPQFQRLVARLGKDVAFLFIQVREPATASRQWLQQQGIRLPVHDSGAKGPRDAHFWLGNGAKISDREVAPLFPSTYVLDRHGLVVFTRRGSAPDWMQYAAFLKDLAVHSGP